jgi:deoxycytidine triphosphate deaminase
MFLIPRTLLSSYVKNKELQIDPLLEEGLGETFYYFHIGGMLKAVSPQEKVVDLRYDKIFSIPPHGFVRIYSLEHFRVSQRILGLFSASSEPIQRKGLSVLNSLAIDPGFTGFLEVGLVNQTEDSVVVQYKDRIGKILFFDVGDTYVLDDKTRVTKMKESVRDTGRAFTGDEDYDLDLGDA